jgi:hypothetical protein
MLLNGKVVVLTQLEIELAAAGVAVPHHLGQTDDDLHTYDATGSAAELPAGSAAVVDAHVPPPPIIGAVALHPVARRVRTIDATPAEVYRATLALLTGYRAGFRLVGIDAGNGAMRVISASIVAKRLNAGAILVGAPVVIANHADTAASAWAITATVSGNDLIITATGAAGRTIDWLLDGEIISFTPNGA